MLELFYKKICFAQLFAFKKMHAYIPKDRAKNYSHAAKI